MLAERHPGILLPRILEKSRKSANWVVVDRWIVGRENSGE